MSYLSGLHGKGTETRTVHSKWIAAASAAMILMVSLAASAMAAGEQFSYALKDFDSGKAQHYKYKSPDGVAIRYFIVKSSDGVVRAAFDACDVCWPADKGYTQKGDVMVCRNCGRRFPTFSINEVQGGCNPAPLTREIVDGRLVIKAADLVGGKHYFDFSQEK